MPQVNRTEIHCIRKSNKHYTDFENLCSLAKDLYNQGNFYIRQAFFISRDLRAGKTLSEAQINTLDELNSALKDYDLHKRNKNKEVKLISESNSHLSYEFLAYFLKSLDCYKALSAQTSQKVLRNLCTNWTAYLGALAAYKKNKESFCGVPSMPKYKKQDGRASVQLTNQQCKVVGGKLYFPQSLGIKPFKIKTKEKFLHVSIVPHYKHFTLEVSYQREVPEQKPDNQQYLSIDIGADNLAALVSNQDLTPILITGKGLQNLNAYYNDEAARLKNIAKKTNNRYYTNRIDTLTNKRNAKIKDYMHKASRYIITYALEHNVNTIVIGYNKNLKRTAMSKKGVRDLSVREQSAKKKARKTYVPIPHLNLVHMIQYKAEEVGIRVICTEEKYTSGTSFLDHEAPTEKYYNKTRRITRGLFQSNKGTLINADVNGALQILKKAVPTYDTFYKNYLNPVRVAV